MSDDGSSDSSSDGEDLLTTGLIATRAKRSTAGNLYATLRQNLDDEELQKELLAEDEEDAGDYEGSDRDGDDDEAMESSSDEEDGGPPKDGEAEDLEGERELKKVERAEARKKRKLEQAKMRVPGWQQKKRVKLADDAKPEDGTPERPKKKSDRLSWATSGADAPIRQSERASAVANREITHAHLKQSAARSEKQRKVMKNAAVRERANKRAQLTQEERFAKAAKIEKETSREFGRWEREEAERQRIREEQLAAKRRRNFEGSVIRHWSGSVLWEGEKVKIKRMHGSKSLDEIKDELEKIGQKEASASATTTNNAASAAVDLPESRQKVPNVNSTELPQLQTSSEPANATEASSNSTVVPLVPDAANKAPPTAERNPQPQTTWLAGIYEYAAQPAGDDQHSKEDSANHQEESRQPLYMPSAPTIHTPTEAVTPPAQAPVPAPTMQPSAAQQQQQLQPQQLQAPIPSSSVPVIPQQVQPLQPPNVPQSASQMYHVWTPGFQQFPLQQPAAPPSPAPALPLIREQARRSLVMLDQFDKLDAPAPSKRGSGRNTKDAALEPTALGSTMFPSAYPGFTPDETRYLTAKMRKRGPEHLLPPAPGKIRCAVTSWPAKFRDPKTGLPYAELQTYKMIQRLLAGGCAWSGFLGAWVGPAYGAMGRPAKGVPDGFAVAPAPTPTPAPAQSDVKTEEAGAG